MPSAGGPVLSKPHTASTSDTWLFNNLSYPIFDKANGATSVSHDLLSDGYTQARGASSALAPGVFDQKLLLPSTTGHQNAEGSVKLSTAFVEKFRQIYGALVAHLKQKGWLQHVRAIFLDEPVR